MEQYSSAFILPNTNKIFIDYPCFKRQESDINIVSIVHNLICQSLTIYSSFELHLNLHLFTISSFQKHKNLIQSFAKIGHEFSEKISHLYVYYTPNIIDSIFKFISLHTRKTNKKTDMTLYSKHESESAIHQIFYQESPMPLTPS